MGVYNDEQYLKSSIRSLLHQTFSDFELVIVDDASVDSSVDIVRSFDDPRIRLIQNEKNLGLTKSLNRALSLASGEYVARQDADDYSHKERFERQVRFLEKHPNVALVGTGAHLVNANGETHQRRVVPSVVTFSDLLNKNYIIHGSILARKDVFESVGQYDDLFRYSQDLDMWLRIAEEHEIRNIPEPLYYFRIHDESVYFSSKENSMLYAQLALERATGGVKDDVLCDIHQNGIEAYYKHLTNEQQQTFHESLAERYLRYGYLAEARDQCRRAFERDGWSTKARLLYLLSYLGQTPTNVVHETVRRVTNAKIELRNRLDSSRDD